MTQTICPLFGEFVTDNAVARASLNRPGIVAKPAVVATLGASWGIVFQPDADIGFWAWRAPWALAAGSPVIMESYGVTVSTGLLPPTPGSTKHVLIVGRWKWIAGAVDGEGVPTGVLAEAMKAVYEAIEGTESTTPVDPSVPATDGEGRPGVVLARIVMTGTSATIEWLADTMLDLAAMGLLIEGKHNRTGDEVHTGHFEVTETPAADNDVVRLIDVQEGVARMYANGAFGEKFPTTVSPLSAGVSMAIPIKVQSGMNVEENPAGGWTVTADGIYRIDFDAFQHGSNTAGDYLHSTVAIKRLATSEAGFAEVLAYEWDYQRNGMSEAQTNSSLMVELFVGDIIGFFIEGAGYSEFNCRALVQNMGARAPSSVIAISTGDTTFYEAVGQAYPGDFSVALAAINNAGVITWSIDAAGAGEIDGTTTPAATILTGPSRLQVSFPTAPSIPASHDVKLRAVDASGFIATKTITVTLASTEPFAITTANQSVSGYPGNYPLAVSFGLASENAVGAVTWAIVAGADTTLPDAAVAGSTVTGSATASAAYKVKVSATDSSSPTPQVIYKVITVTAYENGGGGGGGCFVAGTKILMGDGTTKAIEEIQEGEMVLGIRDGDHQSGVTTPIQTPVLATLVHQGIVAVLEYLGFKMTPGHRWGTTNAAEGSRGWTQSKDIKPGLSHNARQGNTAIKVDTQQAVGAGSAPVVFNLSTGTKTFYVVDADGMAYLVHNIKPFDPTV